ncbi:MAG: hypothetical protein ABSE99_13600 [Terracidiphilus sp.]|jgi:hypothetical protein
MNENMHELSEVTPAVPCGLVSGNPQTVSSLASLRQMEIEASLARLHALHRLRAQQRQEQQRKLRRRLLGFWPIAIGIVLACFAPDLQNLVSSFQPWGMRLMFPFVVISGRHEIQFGDTITRMLPQVMLYIQFPFEGLLAKMALKSRVTFSGVAGQLFFFHFLGATELWLVSGTLG